MEAQSQFTYKADAGGSTGAADAGSAWASRRIGGGGDMSMLEPFR
jgi:hypothetical protein